MSRISSASSECPLAMAICKAGTREKQNWSRQARRRGACRGNRHQCRTRQHGQRARTCDGGRDSLSARIRSCSHEVPDNFGVAHACCPMQGRLPAQQPTSQRKHPADLAALLCPEHRAQIVQLRQCARRAWPSEVTAHAPVRGGDGGVGPIAKQPRHSRQVSASAGWSHTHRQVTPPHAGAKATLRPPGPPRRQRAASVRRGRGRDLGARRWRGGTPGLAR
jgi:hypothetical protein